MLKPLPSYEVARNDFVVSDIENRVDGSVIIIDTCWRSNSTQELEHIKHENWEAYWDWLIKQARIDHRFRCIYAHNGGGWDWLSLARYLLTEGKRKRKRITCSIAGSKMITMVVTIEKQFTIAFCDSLQLLQSSLEKLSHTFLGVGKVDMPYESHEVFAEKDWDTFIEYLNRDTENLILILEKALDILRESVAKIDTFGRTIGATAMKVFRTMDLLHEITIPWQQDIKDFLRLGYRGGRVELFNMGSFDRVWVYDINSLYPYVMQSTKVPTSERGFYTTKYERGQVGCFQVVFSQKKRDIPAVLLSGGKGVYDGEGIYFTPELDLLCEVDSEAEIHIKNGYIFQDTDIIFSDYVEKLYSLRVNTDDESLNLLCKFLLNSLYGKFGQNPIRDQIIAVESFADLQALVESAKIDNKSEPRAMNEFLGVWAIEKDTDCAFEHVGIAGMITSAARCELYKGLLYAGIDTLVYCDTDSVHTTKQFDTTFCGTKLGQYKTEFTGSGTYAGKKLYGLRDDNGVEKIRAKGVTVGGKNGVDLRFDDIRRVTDGEKIECIFHRPASPMQVFKGSEPCIFAPKTRTIRNASYVYVR